MALINCPSCGNKISDKASKCVYCEHELNVDKTIICPECGALLSIEDKICSNCGFPIEQISKNPDEKKSISKGKITGIVLLIIILISAIALAISYNSKLNYEIDTEIAVEDMLYSAKEAEECCLLILDVWNNAIYRISDDETDPYTKENGSFVSDFNDALENLFEDETFMLKIQHIEMARIKANIDMEYISYPPNGYDHLYDMVSEFYDNYMNFTNLAIYPTGSYNSYFEKFSEEQTKLLESGNTIATYIETTYYE